MVCLVQLSTFSATVHMRRGTRTSGAFKKYTKPHRLILVPSPPGVVRFSSLVRTRPCMAAAWQLW